MTKVFGETQPSRFQIYETSGQAWDAMYVAIEQAQRSIYWELYIFIDDDAGQRFFDLLKQKARSGVEVRLIIDGLGSFAVSRRTVASLQSAGVDVRFFSERKHRYRGIWRRLIARTHRKILVVDEHVGFIGGVNIAKNMEHWKDIHVQIRGRAVHSMLRSFAKSYRIAGGPKENVKHLLKYKFRVQQDIDDIEFIYDDSDDHRSSARKKYIEALTKARERVILFSPYYFPDKKFLFALWQARKRGVKVDLLIPFRSDLRIAQYAAYAWFSVMKSYGVNVRLSKDMMHGKGVIVDDDWAMVGSSNLEPGSFHNNYEANVKVHDRFFVRRLKDIVGNWLSSAMSLEDVQWEKRGRVHRLKEWIAMRLVRFWYRR